MPFVTSSARNRRSFSNQPRVVLVTIADIATVSSARATTTAQMNRQGIPRSEAQIHLRTKENVLGFAVRSKTSVFGNPLHGCETIPQHSVRRDLGVNPIPS